MGEETEPLGKHIMVGVYSDDVRRQLAWDPMETLQDDPKLKLRLARIAYVQSLGRRCKVVDLPGEENKREAFIATKDWIKAGKTDDTRTLRDTLIFANASRLRDILILDKTVRQHLTAIREKLIREYESFRAT